MIANRSDLVVGWIDVVSAFHHCLRTFTFCYCSVRDDTFDVVYCRGLLLLLR
jgi:hypothetical protein